MGAIDGGPQVDLSAVSLAQAINMPLLSRERFADLLGISHDTVRAACDRGLWPTIHVGRRVFVNLEAVRAQCLAKAQELS